MSLFPNGIRSDHQLTLTLLDWATLDWSRFETAPERNLFQTRAWLEFIADSKRAKPIVAAVHHNRELAGYFFGLVVQRYGLRALGSPMPGWTTPYMGFSLLPDIDRVQASLALVEFAFTELGCLHVELRDRWIPPGRLESYGFSRRSDVGYDERTFEIDLTLSEDSLFANMSSACRRCIRKSAKEGLTIEEVAPTDPHFASQYTEQLTEVFARQSLVPTYGVDRVEGLMRHLGNADSLLLLRARDRAGLCIATGIFPASADTALFWGGASWREHQGNRPNEALQWHAMRHWKNRGIARYDMGGYVDYKRKYGGEEIVIPGYRLSRYPMVSAARTLAPIAMRAKQSVEARLRGAFERPSLAAANQSVETVNS